MARRRHLSRIAVMNVLFERMSREIDSSKALDYCRDEVTTGLDEEFAKQLLEGVLANEEELKKALEEHAPGWTFERMDPIARCVLLVGAYELLHHKDAPAAVVMNEAIDIAKDFGNEESGKFVNGVLNSMA